MEPGIDSETMFYHSIQRRAGQLGASDMLTKGHDNPRAGLCSI